LVNTTIVTGQRLSATVPVSDLPWLEDSLVAVDAALVRACADWGPEACADAKAAFIFTGLLQQLPPVQLPFGQTMGLGLYPLTFDLAPFMPPALAPVMLPSPHVAGLPIDEDARAALTQAITVYGLTYLADSIAGPSDRPFEADYFRDALVARAEVRLGLSTPPTYSLQARDLLPIASLWEDSRSIPRSLGLPMRLQALSFLETALDGQPATVDGILLRRLRRQPDLKAWLAEALSPDGVTQALNNWETQAAALFEAEGTLSWTALEGLSYTCDTETYLVRDGAAKLLAVAPLWSVLDFPTQALSPDGQYLAFVNQVAADQVALTIYDLKMAATLTITQAAAVFVAGWSRSQELVYIAHDAPADPSTNSASPYHLLRYDQATGNSRRLVENAVIVGYNLSGSWLPDRRGLVLNFDFQDDAAVPIKLWSPAVVSVDGAEAGKLTWLLPMEPRTVYGLLAPNGQWIAYVQRTADDGSFVVANLVLLDIATGARQVILKSKSGADSDGIPIEGDTLSLLGWSGDSAQLMFSTGGTGVLPVTYLFPIDGSRAPLEVARADDNLGVFTSVAHSPDGRYLSYRTFGSPDPVALRLIDLESLDKVEAGTTLVQTLALESSGSAWSTTGHRLAVAGLAGLRVIDLDTGLVRWVETGNCSAVAWYPPPESMFVLLHLWRGAVLTSPIGVTGGVTAPSSDQQRGASCFCRSQSE